MSGRSLLAEIAEQNRLLVAQWQALNVRQRLTVAAVVGGLCFVLTSMSLERRSDHMAILRQQFHIPEQIEFERFQPGNAKSPRHPEIEGVVVFTPEQLSDYIASFGDAEIWSPTPLNYGGRLFEDAYAAALEWRQSAPLPRGAGDRLMNWGNLALPHIYEIENGRHFCFVVLEDGRSASDIGYRFQSCWDLPADADYIVRVQGALDLDTRTLYATVR